MKADIEKITALARDSKFDEAVEMIDAIEAQGFTSPQLQLLKGMYLQLGESEKYSLDDVVSSFERAIELDDEYVEAYIELGWFLCRVVDDPLRARSAFEVALRLSIELRDQAKMGLVECARELRKE